MTSLPSLLYLYVSKLKWIQGMSKETKCFLIRLGLGLLFALFISLTAQSVLYFYPMNATAVFSELDCESHMETMRSSARPAPLDQHIK